MNTSTVSTIVTDYVGTIGTVLNDNLPTILTLSAVVFGLVMIIRYGKRFLAGR